jgi:SAM-dependent methyltransferase
VERTQSTRTAVVWAVLQRELDRAAGRTLTVVDVGGGTGGFAVPLAKAGHRVTVIDASPDALAALTRRAAEAGVDGLISAVQGDADAIADLVEPDSADLMLCHSLLEVVDDPAQVVGAIATALRPGGAASVLVANVVAAVLARAITGNFAAATALLEDPRGGGDRSGPGRGGRHAEPDRAKQAGTRQRDALLRRFDAATANGLLRGAGLVVEEISGVRVLADLVPGVLADADPQALLAFETAAAGRAPWRDIATQLHLLARRPVAVARPVDEVAPAAAATLDEENAPADEDALFDQGREAA